MTNAEYLIKNGIKFTHLYSKWDGFDTTSKISKFKILHSSKGVIGEIKTDSDDTTMDVLEKWLDMEYDCTKTLKEQFYRECPSPHSVYNEDKKRVYRCYYCPHCVLRMT